MRRWFQSLFGRIFLLSVTTSLFVTALFSYWMYEEKAVTFARATAPLWATALASVRAAPAAGPAAIVEHAVIVPTSITLRPGPPPADATAIDFMPRYRALKEELRDLGVPVGQIRLSEDAHGSVTWLALNIGGKPAWVGIPGAHERADRRRRSTTGLIMTVLGFLLAAWWLSRRIAEPLAELEAHLRDPATLTGAAAGPRPLAERGPLEVRHLIRHYNEYALERHRQEEGRNMMLAALSHDLRSPLGRIRMATALLPDHDPEVAKRREVIDRNVHAADQMLASFLDLGRSAIEPLDDDVDLRQLAESLVQASGRADVIVLPMQDNLAALPAVNRLAIERALHNLLDNAVKYGRGPFEIAAGMTGLTWWMSVRDHGQGIPAAQRDQLTRPFYRADHGRGLPGAGLGLAIVVATMARHGGQLALADATPGLRVTLSFGPARGRARPPLRSANDPGPPS